MLSAPLFLLETTCQLLSLDQQNPFIGTEKMAHHNIPLKQRMDRTALQRLISGVALDDGFAQVSSARAHGNRTEVVIHEGRNQIVRRLFEEIEFPVLRLIRTSIGSIKLGELPEGRWRALNSVEVASL